MLIIIYNSTRLKHLNNLFEIPCINCDTVFNVLNIK